MLPDEDKEGVLPPLPENIEKGGMLALVEDRRTRNSADGRTRLSPSTQLVYGAVDWIPIAEEEMEFERERLHLSSEEKDALEAEEELGVFRRR